MRTAWMERVNVDMVTLATVSRALLLEIRANPTLVKMAEHVIQDMVKNCSNARVAKDSSALSAKNPKVHVHQTRALMEEHV